MQVLFRQELCDSGDSKRQGHPRKFTILYSLMCMFRTLPLEHQNDGPTDSGPRIDE